ncbi:hypothetical protein KG112_10695 [Nocardioides sp. zg-ZUI104]|uniref:hypothetical protein n=1 Tax=Nocardioides faecalis TaxID=2803858 RepID=UPI001BCCF967|nr:hypothetical protein [Nocardioides faecalis]MBS4753269.1 hypothetical protein [Nocardioides faecalis]
MLRRLGALMRRPRRRVVLLVLVLVAVVAGGGLLAWRLTREEPTRLAAAVALAPASTQRFGWTDWSAVRAELGSEVSASSSTEELDALLAAAFDRDLASVSALVESAPTLHTEFGFSPASLDWELFAQGADGAVVFLGVGEDFDFAALRERLRAMGFEEPESADGVWHGGVDLLEGLDGPVTPQLAALRLDEDADLLVSGDDAVFLGQVAEDARGDDDGVAAAAAAVGDAVSASVYTGDYTCAELSMSAADPVDRTRAAELIEAAGDINPVTGFAIAAQPGGAVRVAMGFESAEQARKNADSRSVLAAGPAPGQGGSFGDRFDLGRVAARDAVVTMDLTPIAGAWVLSDLNQGPVLFATC